MDQNLVIFVDLTPHFLFVERAFSVPLRTTQKALTVLVITTTKKKPPKCARFAGETRVPFGQLAFLLLHGAVSLDQNLVIFVDLAPRFLFVEHAFSVPTQLGLRTKQNALTVLVITATKKRFKCARFADENANLPIFLFGAF